MHDINGMVAIIRGLESLRTEDVRAMRRLLIFIKHALNLDIMQKPSASPAYQRRCGDIYRVIWSRNNDDRGAWHCGRDDLPALVEMEKDWAVSCQLSMLLAHFKLLDNFTLPAHGSHFKIHNPTSTSRSTMSWPPDHMSVDDFARILNRAGFGIHHRTIVQSYYKKARVTIKPCQKNI
ncbi:unnamed protein product [Fusarium graminearum]|uniref:Uncharacterized protein n=1 Tax=Gibberella zeae TaxID=5518 RepID=A0A4E9E487_GIBZA|nr:unnamed protein product [Fusarium graminearum]CAG1965745.1 unnamed protein product [Fusarium graminearum]CAG1987274.1 unnamed protein product [Fusarium graminearum]